MNINVHAAGRRFASGVLLSLLGLGFFVSGCTSDDEPAAEPPASTTSAPVEPTAADALLSAGLDQVAANDNESAAVTFANVLAIDPSNVAALYNLGYLAQVDGRDDEALDYYDQALAVAPQYVPALYNKAILVEASDLKGATELYREVISINSEAANAYMRLGFALVELGKPKQGAKFLGQGIALDPAMVDVEAPSYS